MPKKTFLYFIFIFQIAAFPVVAATYTTTAVPGTWSPAGPPTFTFLDPGDEIIINHDWSSYNNPIFSNFCGTLTVNSGGYFKIDGTFSNWYNSTIDIKAGGTLQITGGTTFRNQHEIGRGTNSVSNAGTIQIDGDFDNQFCNNCVTCSGLGLAACAADPDCKWNLSTGTVTVAGNYTANGQCVGVLPVELVFLSAKQFDGQNKISWITASEINSAYFEILRSNDGKNYTPITKVTAAGNSNISMNYEYYDEDVMAGQEYYYKLKMVDQDGSFQYSVIMVVKSENTCQVHQLGWSNKFVLSTKEKVFYTIQLHDLQGKLITSFQIDAEENSSHPFSPDYKGTYLISVYDDKKLVITKKGAIQ